MKRIVTIFGLMALLSLNSCFTNDEGPIGPPGDTGPKGEPGESGFVFEWEEINFTAPEYDVLLSYPNDFEPLDSDVALVYFLWGVDEETGNEIWRQLPQTILWDDGILQYNYDFTKYDVRLFLDANFPLDELTADETDEWVARVVVVPGNFWNSGRVDFSDYNEVKEVFGLPDLQKKNNIKNRNF